MGKLAVVEQWHAALNAGDAERLGALCDDQVEIAGPRGAVTGRAVLADWLARSGFSATPARWFCGGDGETVVVEQHATWAPAGAPPSHAVVASRFTVRDGAIRRYARHDDLASALTAAGLGRHDEVATS